MSGKRRRGRWITRGDRLTDWVFSRVVQSLSYEVEGIYLKRFLKDKFRGRERDLCGFLDDGAIYLSKSKVVHRSRDEIARTLLHEAFHFVFDRVLERDILSLEDIVWERLSAKQRAILKFFVPRRVTRSD